MLDIPVSEPKDSGFAPRETLGRIILVYMQRLGTGSTYRITEPIGLKTMAAFVQEKGYGATVVSGSAHEIATMLTEMMRRCGPDAIGFYCDYENQALIESFSRWVKTQWDLFVFVGGPQAVAFDTGFHERSRCDAVVLGEGEYPLLGLLEHFCRGKGKLAQIPGVSHLSPQGRLESTPPGPPIEDLDALPIRQWGVDFTSSRNMRNLNVLTGRGCPFHCAFCYEGSVPGKVRLRSVENVMGEIRQALRQQPDLKVILFADDTFTHNASRVEAFCEALRKLRRTHDLVWFCECHPRTIMKRPELLDTMLESGLVRMQIGLESGSSRVIRHYNKKTTLEQIEALAILCMSKGLPQLTGNMIIGGAFESAETLAETEAFAKKLLTLGPGMTDITSTFFQPLPCTAITKNPSAYGIAVQDAESLTSMGDCAVVRTEALSKEAITAIRLAFTQELHRTMCRLLVQNRIPEERLRSVFRLGLHYGIKGGWYTAILDRDPVLSAYYGQLERGTITASRDVPKNRLPEWYPRFIVDLTEDPDVYSKLSPLERELISACDGRTRREALFRHVHERAPELFESHAHCSLVVRDVLRSFEEKHWIGYAEF